MGIGAMAQMMMSLHIQIQMNILMMITMGLEWWIPVIVTESELLALLKTGLI